MIYEETRGYGLGLGFTVRD